MNQDLFCLIHETGLISLVWIPHGIIGVIMGNVYDTLEMLEIMV